MNGFYGEKSIIGRATSVSVHHPDNQTELNVCQVTLPLSAVAASIKLSIRARYAVYSDNGGKFIRLTTEEEKSRFIKRLLILLAVTGRFYQLELAR